MEVIDYIANLTWTLAVLLAVAATITLPAFIAAWVAHAVAPWVQRTLRTLRRAQRQRRHERLMAQFQEREAYLHQRIAALRLEGQLLRVEIEHQQRVRQWFEPVDITFKGENTQPSLAAMPVADDKIDV